MTPQEILMYSWNGWSIFLEKIVQENFWPCSLEKNNKLTNNQDNYYREMKSLTYLEILSFFDCLTIPLLYLSSPIKKSEDHSDGQGRVPNLICTEGSTVDAVVSFFPTLLGPVMLLYLTLFQGCK